MTFSIRIHGQKFFKTHFQFPNHELTIAVLFKWPNSVFHFKQHCLTTPSEQRSNCLAPSRGLASVIAFVYNSARILLLG